MLIEKEIGELLFKDNYEKKNILSNLIEKKKTILYRFDDAVFENNFAKKMEWINKKKISSFHKAKDLKKEYDEFLAFNNYLSQKFEEENFLIKKIVIEEILIKKGLFVELKWKDGKEFKIEFYKKIHEAVKDFLMIYLNVLKEKIIIDTFFQLIISLVMYSENTLTEKFEIDFEIDFPLIPITINKAKPVLFVNNFLQIEDRFIGEAYYLPDYAMRPIKIIKNNPLYGAVERIEDKKIVKKNEYNANTIFWHNLMKYENVEMFIDWFKMNQIINYFKKKIEWNKNLVTLEELKNELKKEENKDKIYFILQLIEIERFKKYFLNYKSFYYTPFYDFRGRKYYNSIISITNFPCKRYFVYYGYYDRNELKLLIKKSLNSKAHKIILKKWKTEYEIFLKKISYSNAKEKKFVKGMILNLLANVGMIYKKEILKKSETGFSFSLDDMIYKGFEKICLYEKNGEKEILDLDTKDFLKIQWAKEKLTQYWDIKKKEMIGLDFSCSGHQIRYLHMEPEKETTYELLNVAGTDKYTDLYSLIIKIFKNKIFTDFDKNKEISLLIKNKNDLEDLFNTLMKRETLKKSIMTCEYNIRIPKFIEYFKKEVLKRNLIDKEEFTNKEKEINFLMITLYKICNDLGNTDEFKCKFMMKEAYEIIKRNGFCVKMEDGFYVNIGVFKEINSDKRICVRIPTGEIVKRFTTKIKIYSQALDEKKTKTAFVANYIHAKDGLVVRSVRNWNNSQNYLSVHDEFWIPIQETMIFKDKINKILNKNNNRYNFCIIN